jgi:hypothetical protein
MVAQSLVAGAFAGERPYVPECDLTELDSHFRFGADWRSFAELLDDGRIEAAIRSLQELVGSELSGESFLDIGCGSGLSSLAAALRSRKAPRGKL